MSICAERVGAEACDFTFVLVEAPTAPPNAFQTRSSDGKPVITVNSSLLAQLQDDNEIATVLSHEAAHHVAGHIDRMNDRTSRDAFLPRNTGGDTAQPAGRARGRALELEADWIGAFIAERSGYDPAKGAGIFERAAAKQGGTASRTSSHPDPSQRLEVVSAAVAEIGRQRSAGLTPRVESAPPDLP